MDSYTSLNDSVEHIIVTKLPWLADKLRPYFIGPSQSTFNTGALLSNIPFSAKSVITPMWNKEDKNVGDGTLLCDIQMKVQDLEIQLQCCRTLLDNLSKDVDNAVFKKKLAVDYKLNVSNVEKNSPCYIQVLVSEIDNMDIFMNTMKTKQAHQTIKLTKDNLLVHNAIIQDELHCPTWACCFGNIQQHLEYLYRSLKLERIDSDDKILAYLLSEVLSSKEHQTKKTHNMQDLIMWKFIIKTGSVRRKTVSAALRSFMKKHFMGTYKVDKILVALYKVKCILLYGSEFHRQCWYFSGRSSKHKCDDPQKRSRWFPKFGISAEVKSLPDMEYPSSCV